MKKQLLELQKRQAKHPEGKIIHSTKKKGINWFVSDGKTKEYTSDKAIIEALVRKKYELMLLEELQDEEKILERYEKLLEKKKSEEMLEPTSIFQKYLINSYQSKSEKIKSWIEKPKIQNNYHTESLQHGNKRGELFRSKAENMIAIQLKIKGIPYRYENQITINGNTYIPDFTIINPKTDKLVIWEHLGKIQNVDYVRKNLKKMGDYVSAGWIPGINLILTSETLENPLTDTMIEKTIDMYFD